MNPIRLESYEAVARDIPWLGETEVWLTRKEPGSKRYVIHIVDGQPVEDEVELAVEPKPTLSMDRELLRLLVDCLTNAVPPTKREVVESQLLERERLLEQTKYHLEDMPRLVFDSQ